jgi:hypothetical protein
VSAASETSANVAEPSGGASTWMPVGSPWRIGGSRQRGGVNQIGFATSAVIHESETRRPLGERLDAPGPPMHRILGMLLQVRAHRALETVHHDHGVSPARDTRK